MRRGRHKRTGRVLWPPAAEHHSRGTIRFRDPNDVRPRGLAPAAQRSGLSGRRNCHLASFPGPKGPGWQNVRTLGPERKNRITGKTSLNAAPNGVTLFYPPRFFIRAPASLSVRSLFGGRAGLAHSEIQIFSPRHQTLLAAGLVLDLCLCLVLVGVTVTPARDNGVTRV